MKIIERDILTQDDVRRMCIERELYKKGTNKEYQRMLEKCHIDKKGPITVEELQPIAEDIQSHSDGDIDLSSVMWLLSRAARRMYTMEY